MNTSKQELERQEKEREACTKAIVEDQSAHKLVVAGPGTGKTFTFRKLLATKPGENLALTFINNLANDLRDGLGDLADAYTFHGYCKQMLHKLSVDGIDKHFHFYPCLKHLVAADAGIIGQGWDTDDLEEAFQRLANDGREEYFLARGNYYNAVGFSDSVRRVVDHFSSNTNSIPEFGQIVVDEYQDFTALEVTLLDLLAQKSAVLIVGDDDQAVYGFKYASADHIREKAEGGVYKRFELPFCGRCTSVIVDAVHSIIEEAANIGLLGGRVDKRYECFYPEKQAESKLFPKVVHVHCSVHNKKAPYVCLMVDKILEEITQDDIQQARKKGHPCVLICGPSHYTKPVFEHLRGDYPDIDFKTGETLDIDVLDGYRILARDPEANLGWRIILEFSDATLRHNVVIASHELGNKLSELLPKEFREAHLAIAELVLKLLKEEGLDEQQEMRVAESCGGVLDDIRKRLGIETEEDEGLEIDQTKPSIKMTTVIGSKGLSASYVIIVGMNNGDFPRDPNNISDGDVCALLVGLTRTRKCCFLISNGRFGAKGGIRQSVFIRWIGKDNVDSFNANKDTFNS